MTYHPPPAFLPAFSALRPVRRKTPIRGGGGLRKRWKDDEGFIYEWDSLHGLLEKYDQRGRHLGEFNPITGRQLNPAAPTRSIVP
ncbi:MAG: colicin E3/pyocin S6 family cytotoxin [Phycisphaerales bacterium]